MENGAWLSDYVLGILKSPTWVVPTMEFIDQKAILFDETEESTHEQMQCHQDFQELVTNLFLAHLTEVEITEEQFEAFIEVGLSTDGGLHVHRVLAEQLLAAEDFLSFKAMMCKHNADLCHEVVTVEETTDPASPSLRGLVSDVVRNSLESGLDEWQIYDAQKWQGSGPSTEEAEEARRKCEEAELQQAIALSLSIEEEKLRQLAVQEQEAQPEIPLPPSAGFISAPLIHLPPKPFPEATATTAAPPRLVPVAPMISKKPWGFTSAPLIPRPPAPPPPPETPVETVETVETPAAPPIPATVPRLPGRAGFTSSPLCIVPPKPRVLVQPHTSPLPPESEPDSPLSPKSPGSPLSPGSLASLNHYRANLQLWKHRASLAVEPVPEELKEAQRRSRVLSDERLRADSGTSEMAEDRQRRAEHLRRQRDKLLGKRRKEREEQLHEFTQALRPADGISLSQEDRAALGRRLVAELSGATLAESTAHTAPEAAAQMRQALTRQLLQSLASSMHSDAATLEDRLNQLETMRWSSG